MPWPQDAYVGQKVVCVQNNCFLQGIAPIQVNGIYTIASIFLVHNEACFTLEEIAAGSSKLNPHMTGFHHPLFRPLQSTSTGFSILAKLQNPTSHRDLDDVAPNSPVRELI